MEGRLEGSGSGNESWDGWMDGDELVLHELN